MRVTENLLKKIKYEETSEKFVLTPCFSMGFGIITDCSGFSHELLKDNIIVNFNTSGLKPIFFVFCPHDKSWG